MKLPKRLVRNPDGTKMLVRSAKLAVSPTGEVHDLAGQRTLCLAPGENALPDGWRWLDPRDLDDVQLASTDEWGRERVADAASAATSEPKIKKPRNTPGAKRGFRVRF